MKKKTLSIIALCALVAILVSPVLAVNMTITNFATGKQDLMIYNPNGTLIGLYNTSSPIIPLPDTDFQVVIRPNTASSWINNPFLFFSDMIGFLMTNFAPVFLILCMIAVASGLAYYGKKR